jgi:hypothetical protein
MTSLQQKYQPVIQLVKDYANQAGEIWEENQMLHIRATVETSLERDLIREKIEEVNGTYPPDLEAEISIRQEVDPPPSNPQTETAKIANRYRKD